MKYHSITVASEKSLTLPSMKWDVLKQVTESKKTDYSGYVKIYWLDGNGKLGKIEPIFGNPLNVLIERFEIETEVDGGD